MTPEIERIVNEAEGRKYLAPKWPWGHLAALSAEVRRLNTENAAQRQRITDLENALADGKTFG